jgi:hypothetical protein
LFSLISALSGTINFPTVLNGTEKLPKITFRLSFKHSVFHESFHQSIF